MQHIAALLNYLLGVAVLLKSKLLLPRRSASYCWIALSRQNIARQSSLNITVSNHRRHRMADSSGRWTRSGRLRYNLRNKAIVTLHLFFDYYDINIVAYHTHGMLIRMFQRSVWYYCTQWFEDFDFQEQVLYKTCTAFLQKFCTVSTGLIWECDLYTRAKYNWKNMLKWANG